ncbi:hypothetical protein PR048_019308 [Dryococelus australis]|uniref:Zinc finger PHD-type domain-containing protein n=1 Tax=Dryococelus australis TaxID=614101 RepID=A0ABQ9H380_9NEOP|nr:hypothetical protein PR048_019308 [Dryococelus australis]
MRSQKRYLRVKKYVFEEDQRKFENSKIIVFEIWTEHAESIKATRENQFNVGTRILVDADGVSTLPHVHSRVLLGFVKLRETIFICPKREAVACDKGCSQLRHAYRITHRLYAQSIELECSLAVDNAPLGDFQRRPYHFMSRDVRPSADRRERACARVPRRHYTINTNSYGYLLHQQWLEPMLHDTCSQRGVCSGPYTTHTVAAIVSLCGLRKFPSPDRKEHIAQRSGRPARPGTTQTARQSDQQSRGSLTKHSVYIFSSHGERPALSNCYVIGQVRKPVRNLPRKIGRVHLPNLVRNLPVQGGKYHDGCHASPYTGRYGGSCTSSYGIWYRVTSPTTDSEINTHAVAGVMQSKLTRTSQTTRNVKKDLTSSDTVSECDNIDEKDICDEAVSDEVSVFDEEKCLMCGEFGMENEMWYRFTVCGLWAHSLCTGWESPEGYICDLCFRSNRKGLNALGWVHTCGQCPRGAAAAPQKRSVRAWLISTSSHVAAVLLRYRVTNEPARNTACAVNAFHEGSAFSVHVAEALPWSIAAHTWSATGISQATEVIATRNERSLTPRLWHGTPADVAPAGEELFPKSLTRYPSVHSNIFRQTMMALDGWKDLCPVQRYEPPPPPPLSLLHSRERVFAELNPCLSAYSRDAEFWTLPKR